MYQRKRTRKQFWMVAALALVGGMTMVQQTSAAIIDLILASGATELEIKLRNFDNGTLYPTGTSAGFANAGAAGPGAATAAQIAAGVASVDGVAGQVGAAGAIGAEDTWGVFRVTEIFGNHDGFNTPIWAAASDATRELTGMFYGESDYYVSTNPLDIDSLLIEGTGMNISLFEDTTPDWDQTAAGVTSVAGGSVNRAGTDDFRTVTDIDSAGLADAGATLALHGISEAGHINQVGSFGGAAAEFRSLFDPTASTGSGLAYFSVLGGTWAPFLDSNAFVPTAGNAALGYKPADLKITFTTEPTSVGPTPGYDWLVRSNDPVSAFVVPEPTSLALLLLGVGAMMRRPNRRRAA